jgi:hypothetical protein
MSDLGRYRLGEYVPLSVTTLATSAGSATAPTSAPTVTVHRTLSTIVNAKRLPPTRPAATGQFSADLFLGSDYAVGTHSANYAWTAGAYNGTAQDTFEVVQGGSVQGPVIAASWMPLPHANYVLYKTDDGTLRKGRNPTVEV